MNFDKKTLLITGGTGSFGHAVLNRFVSTDIKEIRIFSRDEKKQDDMRHAIKSEKVKFYIGDVRDPSSIDFAMRGVDYVFHAAALKQVPSCEFYPLEAVKTNIFGAQNVIDSALRHKVQRVIALSTDKAVGPANAMGMTKGLMEKVMSAKARTTEEVQTCLLTTRYGNVLASRGSVVPLFISQIMKKEAITVTDPEMTRFLMTLENAVELVLFAFQNGNQGDLFVQKSPAATVLQIAEALKSIFGAKSSINIIGTRHGEKKHETLLSREERARSEDMLNYFRVCSDARGLNYGAYFKQGESNISRNTDYTSENTSRLNHDELVSLLMSLDCVREALKSSK